MASHINLQNHDIDDNTLDKDGVLSDIADTKLENETPIDIPPPTLQEFLGSAYNAISTKCDSAITATSAPSTRRKDANMDGFEVRLRFSSLLQHLNASVASASKAAQYALKHKSQDEDLHSVILEQLEQVSH